LTARWSQGLVNGRKKKVKKGKKEKFGKKKKKKKKSGGGAEGAVRYRKQLRAFIPLSDQINVRSKGGGKRKGMKRSRTSVARGVEGREGEELMRRGGGKIMRRT